MGNSDLLEFLVAIALGNITVAMAYLGRGIHWFFGMDSDPAWRKLVAMVPSIGSTWKEAGDEFKPKGLKKKKPTAEPSTAPPLKTRWELASIK